MAGVVAVAWLASLKNAIGVENRGLWNRITAPAPTPDDNYIMPRKESDRLDVLILGARGMDDPDAQDSGPLLTDSIEILSYDKKTGSASLVSVPRDLEVIISDKKTDKVNVVYEYGYYHSSDPLTFVKNKFSQITGVYIDKVVVLNFSSFQEIIDSLGGIDITLAKPFTEAQQWGYEFHLPAGPNHLSGQDALYYARSRYSSSDFDRSQRQQQIIFAIKDKLLALDLLNEPVKTFNIFNMIRKDISTDIGVFDINQFLELASAVDFSKINRFVITNNNLLYDAKNSAGLYILLPYGGNFDGIKQFFQNILYGGPLPTPVPSK